MKVVTVFADLLVALEVLGLDERIFGFDIEYEGGYGDGAVFVVDLKVAFGCLECEGDVADISAVKVVGADFVGVGLEEVDAPCGEVCVNIVRCDGVFAGALSAVTDVADVGAIVGKLLDCA